MPRCCSTPGSPCSCGSISCQSHCAGNVCDGEVLQPPLDDPGCTHSNSPTGKFSWLGVGLDSAGKIFSSLCSAFSLPKHTNLSSSICLAVILGPCTRLWLISWQDLLRISKLSMAGDAQRSQAAALGEQHLPGTGGAPGSAGMSSWGH